MQKLAIHSFASPTKMKKAGVSRLGALLWLCGPTIAAPPLQAPSSLLLNIANLNSSNPLLSKLTVSNVTTQAHDPPVLT